MHTEKNQYLLGYSLPHYRPVHCAAFICHLLSQHQVSTFGIEKLLVSPADFSTRPVGRALWEESIGAKLSYLSLGQVKFSLDKYITKLCYYHIPLKFHCSIYIYQLL